MEPAWQLVGVGRRAPCFAEMRRLILGRKLCGCWTLPSRSSIVSFPGRPGFRSHALAKQRPAHPVYTWLAKAPAAASSTSAWLVSAEVVASAVGSLPTHAAKALSVGSEEAALDRALADARWLRDRVAEATELTSTRYATMGSGHSPSHSAGCPGTFSASTPPGIRRSSSSTCLRPSSSEPSPASSIGTDVTLDRPDRPARRDRSAHGQR